MWASRRTAERQVPHTDLETAVAVAEHEGFERRSTNNTEVQLRKPGTWFTMSVDKIPLQLTLTEGAGSDIALTLRYDQFVAFDTGDLEAEADRLAGTLQARA